MNNAEEDSIVCSRQQPAVVPRALVQSTHELSIISAIISAILRIVLAPEQ
jgi:hypothetical protein